MKQFKVGDVIKVTKRNTMEYTIYKIVDKNMFDYQCKPLKGVWGPWTAPFIWIENALTRESEFHYKVELITHYNSKLGKVLYK